MRRSLTGVMAAVCLLVSSCAGGDDTSSSDEPVPLQLLVADSTGIAIWSQDARSAVWSEEPVALAMPDHRGGVVFQVEGPAPQPIRLIPRIGADPVVLVEDPGAEWILLEDVAVIDGVPTLVYRVSRTLPNDCADDEPECRWESVRHYLVIHDLESGAERTLGVVGGFESSGVRFGFGGDRAVIWYSPYGETVSCVGLLDASGLVEGHGSEEWVVLAALEAVRWLWPGSCDDLISGGGDAGTVCAVASGVAIDDGGSSVAVASAQWRVTEGFVCSETAEPIVVLVDAATGVESARLQVPEPGATPDAMDFDGEHLLISRQREGEPIDPLLVERDGTVTVLQLDGTLRIWPGRTR